MAPTIPEEYAELMKGNGDGHYLYKPQPYSTLHPGAIGYFDKYGAWNQITDISEPGRPEKDGFTGLGRTLAYEEPNEATWRTRSSGSEAESSFGLTGGLSGAVAAAPMDVSANAKNKWGKTGKAALISESVVKNERFKPPFSPSIQTWVKQNAKALVNSDWGEDIKEYGLWAIQTTWSTQECAITMESAHSRDTSAGLDVGATGVGKVGASGSSLAKLKSEGWTTYQATEKDQALVVSYGGAGYRLHKIPSFRSNPLKRTERQAAKTLEYAKLIFDDEGNQIGAEIWRPVFDENGNEIGEEKVDKEAEKEAEKKQAEEESAEVEEDFDFDIECETVGMTESDVEADKEHARELEEQKKEFAKKVAVISKITDETQKKAEMAKLLAANAVTVNYTTTV